MCGERILADTNALIRMFAGEKAVVDLLDGAHIQRVCWPCPCTGDRSRHAEAHPKAIVHLLVNAFPCIECVFDVACTIGIEHLAPLHHTQQAVDAQSFTVRASELVDDAIGEDDDPLSG